MLKSERITEAIMSSIRSGLKSVISELFGQMADGEELSSESLEKGIWDACRELSREVLEHIYAEFHSDYRGTAIECECGSWQRFINKRSRSHRTLFGQIRVWFSYYRCDDCGESVMLGGSRFGADGNAYSSRLRRLMSILSSHLPYRQASELLLELTGERVSVCQFERVVCDVGRGFEAIESDSSSRALNRCSYESEESPEHLYVSIDGAMVRIENEWRECKVAAVFDGRVDDNGSPRQGQTTYQAGIWDADDLGNRAYLEALRRGLGDAKRLVVLGDGAKWIWNQSDTHFPDAIEILDWYHACEHLWEVAREFYGDGTERCRRWVDAQKGFLMGNKVGVVIRNIDKLRARTKQQVKVQKTNLGYFRRNRKRMRYGTYRKQGLFIGSGTVESACKHLVQQRFKGAGMRWSKDGFKHLMAIRTAWKNNRFEKRWLQYKKAA